MHCTKKPNVHCTKKPYVHSTFKALLIKQSLPKYNANIVSMLQQFLLGKEITMLLKINFLAYLYSVYLLLHQHILERLVNSSSVTSYSIMLSKRSSATFLNLLSEITKGAFKGLKRKFGQKVAQFKYI